MRLDFDDLMLFLWYFKTFNRIAAV